MQHSRILDGSFMHWGDLIADSMVFHWPKTRHLYLSTKEHHCHEEIRRIMDRFVIFRAVFGVKEIKLEIQIIFARMQSDDQSSYRLKDESRAELENRGMESFIQLFTELGSKYEKAFYNEDDEVNEWVVSHARINFPEFDCLNENPDSTLTLDYDTIATLSIFDDEWEGPAPLEDRFLAEEFEEVYRKLVVLP